MNNKRVLLINPPETEQSDFSNPPLGLLYLASSLLKENINVEVIDGCLEGWEKLEQKIRTYKPDIVGVTCLTPDRKKALRVAKIAKEINKNALIVLGGVHPTIMYEQLLNNYSFIDICVLGEGEKTLIEIVQNNDYLNIDGIAYKRDNKITVTKPRKYVENLDEIPFPAWHLIDLQRYPSRGKGIFNGVDLSKEVRVSIIFSRGCVGRCSFCSTWWIWRGWRCRSAKNMADEIELLNNKFKISHFCFADDALTVNRLATLDLCNEIIKRKLKIAFHVTTRVDLVDEELLNKLKEAGCYNIAYGIETASSDLLEKMGKGIDIDTSKKAILLTKKIGIKTTALLIAGSEGETIKTVNQTVNFLKETQPDEVGSVGGLWILPGTKLYFNCKKLNFIDDKFWLGNKPHKLYTLEHNRLVLRIFNYAYKTKSILSESKITNLIKFTPFIIREWLSDKKSSIKHFLRKIINK